MRAGGRDGRRPTTTDDDHQEVGRMQAQRHDRSMPARKARQRGSEKRATVRRSPNDARPNFATAFTTARYQNPLSRPHTTALCQNPSSQHFSTALDHPTSFILDAFRSHLGAITGSPGATKEQFLGIIEMQPFYLTPHACHIQCHHPCMREGPCVDRSDALLMGKPWANYPWVM